VHKLPPGAVAFSALLCLALALSQLTSCAGSFERPGMKVRPILPTVTVTITGECSVPPETEATEGGFVKFCNEMQCTVSIVFPLDSPFAYDSIRLDPGECLSLRVLSDTSDPVGYGYCVSGPCCGERPMSTPEIKVAPPPPYP
jgi:hypothetical protein